MSDAISESYAVSRLYQWATAGGHHGTATVAQLEAAGWVRVREHDTYPGSWLMQKDEAP